MSHSSDAGTLDESRQTRRAVLAFVFVRKLKAAVVIPNSPLHRAAGATKKDATHHAYYENAPQKKV